MSRDWEQEGLQDRIFRALSKAFPEPEASCWVNCTANPNLFEVGITLCPTCALPDDLKPSHNGSRRCESGSIASGGTKAHCSCDLCF